MSSRILKFRLPAAFAALAMLAFAVSCRGFFQPEQLSSITISPSSANVPLGGTLQLQAFGTNTDSTSAGNITGKVSWSSSSGAISVNGGGLLTGNDLTSSAVTITAEDQGVSATSTANVCVENGTNYKITFSPTSGTVGGTAVSAYAYANVSGITGAVDISSGVTWSSSNPSVTVTAGDPATIDISALTSPATVTIFATYTCNGVNSNFQSNLTIN